MTEYKKPLKWFVRQMDAKLKENLRKDNWRKESVATLFGRLLQEVGELAAVMWTQNYDDIIKESADVANFAMTIADQALGLKEASDRRHK